MRTGRLSKVFIILAWPFVGLIAGCHSPSRDLEQSQSMPPPEIPKLAPEDVNLPTRDLSYIFIEDPDGKKVVWALSQEGKDKTASILAGYPRKTIDGTIFYKVNSWNDISKLAKVVSEDHDKMIWNLFNEISYLKLRVTKLEKALSEIRKDEKNSNN
jgi:hypothetical protein